MFSLDRASGPEPVDARTARWAMLNTDAKTEAIRISTEFMDLHREHWPGFEGESEVTPIYQPDQLS